MGIAEKACIALMFVSWGVLFACLSLSLPSWKVLMHTPISAPRLSDRRLHTLYILFGLLGSVMLAQLILGLIAGMPIKFILLCIFVFDQAFPFPYGIHFSVLLSLLQTRKAKKQIQENGGEPLPAMTYGEASKTPRIRSFRVLLLVFGAIGVLIGVLAQFLKGSDAQNTLLVAAVIVIFVLGPVAALIHWLIFRKKE